MYFDLSLEDLLAYLPDRKEPEDFDAFWDRSLSQSNTFDLSPRFQKVDFGLDLFETFDVTFSGYQGQEVRGWFIKPAGGKPPFPCVIQYIGYGGGRGLPTDWLLFPAAGFAAFIMDTRGQGSAWLAGDTPDIPSEGSSPHYPGFMTLGILDPHTYYYRRVFVDACRAVQVVNNISEVDPERIVVTGRSQGGGISLAVSGLVKDLDAVMPDVPYLCNFPRAVSITDEMPYHEISRFLKVHREKVDQVFQTLSYFDGMNFAVRASAPALFSIGMMDPICPPSTVFSAFNYYRGKKQFEKYDFNLHDGGGSHHEIKQIRFLKERWK